MGSAASIDWGDDAVTTTGAVEGSADHVYTKTHSDKNAIREIVRLAEPFHSNWDTGSCSYTCATNFPFVANVYATWQDFLDSVYGQGIFPDKNPAYLVCGGAADIECSYVLWNGTDNKSILVPPQSTKFQVEGKYLGYKFCMHAGHPPASAPVWPGCYGKPSAWDNTSGIIARGKNG